MTPTLEKVPIFVLHLQELSEIIEHFNKFPDLKEYTISFPCDFKIYVRR